MIQEIPQTIPSTQQKIAYNNQPDYTQPLLEIPETVRQKLLNRLAFLYGEAQAKACIGELERILKVHYAHKPSEMIAAEEVFRESDYFTQKDMVLITYGDLLCSETLSPLATLEKFLQDYVELHEIFSTIHILPFFPYSSDRGFSITDYRMVDPNLGSWQDIADIGNAYKLMFDGVFNHISAKSQVFQELLNGHPDYKDFATVYRSPDELTLEQRRIIVRPRTSDILTEYQAIDASIWVWTTFSPDQIDLNYRNPQVLLYVIDTLLLYIRRGASLVRLDAVTYLWDEPGTTGANLEQTHQVIKLSRDILDVVAPTVTLVTETNIPHEQNISYFGNGSDEAQIVYNFALPPLVLYTFYTEDSTALSKWADGLDYPSVTTTFLNILDTHDGIGLMGVKNILSTSEIDFIIQKAREHGAFVSYKTGEGGKDEPYEINSTWFSAINLDSSDEPMDLRVKRYVASRSLALVLRGIPGIYFHGLVGTLNDVESVMRTKSKRDINRKILHAEELSSDLRNRNTKLSYLVKQLRKLLEIRVRQAAFHPNGSQQVLPLSPAIFALLRTSVDGKEHILTLTNVTNQEGQIAIDLSPLEIEAKHWYDLVGRRGWMAKDQQLTVMLQPYDVVWLIPFVELERGIESGK